MKNKNLEKLESILEMKDEKKVFNLIYEQLGEYNNLFADHVESAIEGRIEFFSKQNTYYFECLGIKTKADSLTFCQFQYLFMRIVLSTFLNLSATHVANKDEEMELVHKVRKTTYAIEDYLAHIEEKLEYNFYNEYPSTVSNLIYHVKEVLEFFDYESR